RVAEVPVVGELARRALTPKLARAAMPAVIKTMFEPAPVTPTFAQEFCVARATRPSQLSAIAQDSEAVTPAIARLAPAYADLTCPVTVVAGSGDAVLDPQAHSVRFAQAVPHARLTMLPAGHMVHHTLPEDVAAAIRDTAVSRAAASDQGRPS
ncbi:MAG: alpha/beta hydrolase, partial [Pseudomonadota bacterium]